jgi:hypothetical protein
MCSLALLNGLHMSLIHSFPRQREKKPNWLTLQPNDFRKLVKVSDRVDFPVVFRSGCCAANRAVARRRPGVEAARTIEHSINTYQPRERVVPVIAE